MGQSGQSIRFCRSSDGVRLAFAVTGRGPVLVKAATWLNHLEHDWSSPVWRGLLRALASRFTLVRYDERGCGLSDRDVDDLGFERWVTDLEAVVEAAGVERFALLGISQGAAIGVAFSARHPERVSHLVLHGGYARGRVVRATTDAERAEAETMVRLAELGWGRGDPAFRQFFTTQFLPDASQRQHEAFNEQQRLSTNPANAGRLMREFGLIDVSGLTGDVRCPTLVTHSRGDVRVPFDEGRRLAGAIAGAVLLPIDSRNHLLVEDEAEAGHWQRAIVDFIAPGSPRADVRKAIDGLTPRQRELLGWVASGRDNAQIAALMGIGEKTVRNQLSLVLARLALDSRARAIVMAREAGLGLEP